MAEAGRTGDPDQLAAGRARPRGDRPRPGCPAASRSRTAAPSAVDVPTLAFARLSPATDFGAKDGPADLAFLIAAPAGGDATHLKVLTQLARALVKKDFTDGLRSADRPEEVVELVERRRRPRRPRPPPAPARRRGRGGRRRRRGTAPRRCRRRRRPTAAGRRSLVAVTACPTGIAHTYMAAEALEAAAERAGVDLHVETQGSARLHPAAPRT